jgi:phage terminase small subunit
MATKNLTPKERAFVHAYTTDAAGNGTQAAIAAGYAPSNARFQSSRLLTKANVKAAIELRTAKKEAKGIATADERDLAVSEWFRDEALDHGTRLQAARELNRVEGRYTLKVLHSGKLTLEQALDAANERLAARQTKAAPAARK